REPGERAISTLRHVKSRGGNFWLYEHFDLTRMSLDDLIKEPLVQDWMRDYQLKWIAGDFNLTNFTEPMIFQIPRIMDEDFLEKGKKRLSGIEFVGITERFDESLRLLCDTFGWPREEQPPALNRKEERQGAEEEVSEKSLNIIRSLTEYDRRFYDFAYALFEKRLNK
ncbi:MAG: hypothetical protein IT567_06755, partial [Alphaproteobacteria bacterium]|nr:hypothetical protein [Alphaproteobacteria bacterium]